MATKTELLTALITLREWIREPWADDDSAENEAVIDQAEVAIEDAITEALELNDAELDYTASVDADLDHTASVLENSINAKRQAYRGAKQ